ncbi:MAG: hypothetical protein IB618_00075 [Candidatus Pacearchaeota archaeon]|nr:MAG: hypothetical protein IB618_00075 [Candidatus Pacearchaeota archaeon]
MAQITNSLTKELKKRDVIFGPKIAFKKFRDIEKIYLSKDCSIDSKEFPKTSIVIKTDLTREELKELCKKSFNISVVSVLKEEKEIKKKTGSKK